MNANIPLRLLIDLVLLVTFLLAQANIFTANRFHEWSGVFLLLMISLHVVINRRWFLTLFKGHYPIQRGSNLLINLLLVVLFATLTWGAFFISRTVFSFAGVEGNRWLLQMHATLACWLLVVMGIHVGFFLERIQSWLYRLWPGFSWGKHSPRWNLFLQTLLVGCGVYASFEQGMGAKLLLLPSEEDYYLLDQSMAAFCLLNMAIFAMYAILTKWLLHFFKHHSARNASPKESYRLKNRILAQNEVSAEKIRKESGKKVFGFTSTLCRNTCRNANFS
ncbi:MAG: hypothetical protein IAF00_03600 [Phycisphaerales bacterium]|nr:hypothetical protein [Phycisphaerales bacterium]